MDQVVTTANQQGWEAELELGFVHNGSKTVLKKRRHKGPLTVQRPFYPEDGLCHVYLLHPPGGVVAGDKLTIDVSVADNASTLITTPGAAKFYRSSGGQAIQNINLSVAQQASLEWLPQEAIVFQEKKLSSKLDIKLEPEARFLGWEIVVLGRPAADERFDTGEAILNWRIFRDNQPLFLEKMQLDHLALSANWGLNQCSSCGTMIATGATEANLTAIRELIADEQDKAVTLMDDLLICRARSDKTEVVRTFFEQVRALIRQDIVRQAMYTPRIWAT